MQLVYSYRQATTLDIAPMMTIGHEGLRPHIEKVRDWNQEIEEQGFRDHFEPEKIQIIQVSGIDVGYMKTENYKTHVYVDGIYIAKSHRSLGIGQSILTDLINACIEDQKNIRLRVFTVNPALRLYQKLGFKILDETKDNYVMELHCKGVLGGLHWNPFSIEEVSALLCANQDWFFVGGISIDLYLGYKTRSHGDIDIGVLETDAPRLIELLQQAGLSIFTAKKGHLVKFSVTDLEVGEDNFWVSDGEAYRLQLLTYPVRRKAVIFRRNRCINFPIKSFILSVGEHRIINPYVFRPVSS